MSLVVGNEIVTVGTYIYVLKYFYSENRVFVKITNKIWRNFDSRKPFIKFFEFWNFSTKFWIRKLYASFMKYLQILIWVNANIYKKKIEKILEINIGEI